MALGFASAAISTQYLMRRVVSNDIPYCERFRSHLPAQLLLLAFANYIVPHYRGFGSIPGMKTVGFNI